VACVGALFLNPYGARLVCFPLEMQAHWIRALGREWQSPVTSPGWRVVGGGRFVPLAPVFWGYLALLIWALWRRLQHWRTGDLVPLAVMSLWLALALWHLRAVSDAVLLTSPLLAASLAPAPWWRARPWPFPIGSVLLVALASWSVTSARRHYQTHRFRWGGSGSVCTIAAMQRLSLTGRVYMKSHPLADASTLLYHLHPQIHMHHTWDYVTGPTALAEERAIWTQGPSVLQTYVEKYAVTIVVLPTAAFWQRTTAEVLPGWVVVHVDDRFVVMVRQAAAHGLPVYDIIRPWTNATVTPGYASQLLQEAKRALEQYPEGATCAWAYKAEALRLLGRYDESFEAALKIPGAAGDSVSLACRNAVSHQVVSVTT
jgi:hypothetical protein